MRRARILVILLLIVPSTVATALAQRGAEETKQIRAAIATLGLPTPTFSEVSEQDSRFNYYPVSTKSPAALSVGGVQTIYGIFLHTSDERAQASYERNKRDLAVTSSGFNDPNVEPLSLPIGEGVVMTGNGLYWNYTQRIPDPAGPIYTVGYSKAAALCGGVMVTVWTNKASTQQGEHLDEFARLGAEAREVVKAEIVKVMSALQAQGIDCADKGRTPVIFIPGVAGTILTNGVGHEYWPVAPVADRANLAFESDGVTPARNATVKYGDMLRRPGMDFYGDYMKALEADGYKEGVDLVAFPYDWRQSNDSHYARLDEVVKQLLDRTGKKKVAITAHSMGGVIGRGYIYSSAERAGKVEALITMGTPYWGSPKVFYGITSGYQFGNPTVRQELMKVLLQNMPAAYQLLPQAPFVLDKKTGQMLSIDTVNRVKYKWFKQMDLSFRDVYEETPTNDIGFNAGLLAKARDFYARIGGPDRPNPLPSGVKQYAVIGTGVVTLGSYELEDWTAPTLNFWPFTSSYLEIDGRKVVLHPKTTDGDGTVPLWSLETQASTGNFYVPNTADRSAEHGALPANRTVQDIVIQILKKKPPQTSSYPRPAYWLGQPVRPGKEGESMTEFELHSDAHLRITNAAGKTLGLNADGSAETGLPGTFLSYEGKEYAAVADVGSALRASVDGTRTGKFTLNVKTTGGGRPAGEFRYNEVPVSAGTKTELSFTPSAGGSAPDLRVTDGAGTRNVKPVTIQPLVPFNVSPGSGGGPTPQTSPADLFIGTIPAVGGTVTSLKFFENNAEDLPAVGLRPYKTRFPASSLKAVYFELSLKYAVDSATVFALSFIWKKGSETFARQELSVSKPAGMNSSTKTYGFMPPSGKWEPGTYTLIIEVDGQRVASATFTVE